MSTNPFEEGLDRIIDYAVSQPPKYEDLESMQRMLYNQEMKIQAIEAGLSQSLVGHYEKCLVKKDIEGTSRTRNLIVMMLQNILMLKKGREVCLSGDIGLKKLLVLLQDASVDVRVSACKLFETLTQFDDCHDVLLEGKVVMNALTALLLNDEYSVSAQTIPALSSLSEHDPNLDTDGTCIQKLVEYLQANADDAKSGDNEEVHRLVQHILQCLWNITADLQQKDIAIGKGVVTTVTPLLLSLVLEVKRLAMGTIMALAISEKGKEAIIGADGAIESLCRSALKLREFAPTRQNAIVAIQNVIENPKGLLLCGKELLAESEIICDIFAPSQTAKLIDQLLDDRNYTAMCLDALSLTFKDEEGRKAGWDILEVVQRLHILSRRGASQKVKGFARRCLETLCADNLDAQQLLESLPEIEEAEGNGAGEIEGGDRKDSDGEESIGAVPAEQTVVLLVQFQNDFTRKNGKLNKLVADSMEETQMIWNTVDLTEKARRKGAKIIHCPLMMMEEESNQDYGVFQDIVAAKAFVPETWGSAITEELPPETEDDVLKNMTKLSAFEDTGLEDMLKNREVKHIIVCGLCTDAAIDATVRDAYEAGFEIYAAQDCLAASSLAAQENAINEILPKFVKVMTHAQILTKLKAVVDM